MKQSLLLIAIASSLVFTPSCKDVDASDTPSQEMLRDSLFRNYPTIASISLGVEGRSDLTVTIGDPVLYAASDDKKKKEADEIGHMALRIFGKDNFLEKGKLVISKDQKNKKIDPPDGITIPIDIEGMKKAGKQ